MFRIVLDTNTIISGFLWGGKEFELLQNIEKDEALLILNKEILEEIENVINRPKFRALLQKANLSPDKIISKLLSLSHLITGQKIGIKVSRDPDDDPIERRIAEGK